MSRTTSPDDGMMVRLFGRQGRLGHKGKSLFEITKLERLADGIAAIDFGPAIQAHQRLGTSFSC